MHIAEMHQLINKMEILLFKYVCVFFCTFNVSDLSSDWRVVDEYCFIRNKKKTKIFSCFCQYLESEIFQEEIFYFRHFQLPFCISRAKGGGLDHSVFIILGIFIILCFKSSGTPTPSRLRDFWKKMVGTCREDQKIKSCQNMKQ